MNMVRHQAPFFDPALSLSSQLMENFPEMASQLLVQDPASTFRNKNHMVFTLPLGGAFTPLSSAIFQARKSCTKQRIAALNLASERCERLKYLFFSLHNITLAYSQDAKVIQTLFYWDVDCNRNFGFVLYCLAIPLDKPLPCIDP